jgi:hypothetical protein
MEESYFAIFFSLWSYKLSMLLPLYLKLVCKCWCLLSCYDSFHCWKLQWQHFSNALFIIYFYHVAFLFLLSSCNSILVLQKQGLEWASPCCLFSSTIFLGLNVDVVIIVQLLAYVYMYAMQVYCKSQYIHDMKCKCKNFGVQVYMIYIYTTWYNT